MLVIGHLEKFHGELDLLYTQGNYVIIKNRMRIFYGTNIIVLVECDFNDILMILIVSGLMMVFKKEKLALKMICKLFYGTNTFVYTRKH